MFVPFLQLVGCVSSPFLSSFVLSVAEIQPSCFRKSPFLKFGKPSISIGYLDHGYVKSPEGYLFFLFTLSNPQNPQNEEMNTRNHGWSLADHAGWSGDPKPPKFRGPVRWDGVTTIAIASILNSGAPRMGRSPPRGRHAYSYIQLHKDLVFTPRMTRSWSSWNLSWLCSCSPSPRRPISRVASQPHHLRKKLRQKPDHDEDNPLSNRT